MLEGIPAFPFPLAEEFANAEAPLSPFFTGRE